MTCYISAPTRRSGVFPARFYPWPYVAQRIAKHSSSEQARLNGIIFFVRGGSSHQPTRPLHLVHRSSVLESLFLKNSIVLESVNHLLQMQFSVQCNTRYYRQHRILPDTIIIPLEKYQNQCYYIQTKYAVPLYSYHELSFKNNIHTLVRILKINHQQNQHYAIFCLLFQLFDVHQELQQY